MNRFFVITAFLLSNLIIFGKPATPNPILITQSDGVQIEIMLVGDENFHYTTSKDGYLIAQNSKGIYEYATMDNNGLISLTSKRYNEPDKRSQSEVFFLNNLPNRDDFRKIANNKMMKIGEQRAIQRVGAVGEKGIAILVNFADKSFVTPDANTAFNNLLNQQGYSANNAIGSARDYFIKCSDSIFKPTFDVFGPYTLPDSMKHYGTNNGSDIDVNAAQMVIDACSLAHQAGVDFSQYDTDSDGEVDNVFIFFAGHSESSGAPSHTIWPHRYAISSRPEYNGVEVFNYACGSELKGNAGSVMDGIGTFCHEFSHVLGLPDVYNTSTGRSTQNSWDVMDAGCYNGPGRGGDVPCLYSSYERFYAGWLTPEILTTEGSHTLEPLTSPQKKAYIVTQTGTHNLDGKNPISSLFYLLENRKQESWDSYLPASGMLIWRINYNSSSWRRNSPNTSAQYRIDIMNADGSKNASNMAGDVYPGSSRKTSYSFHSVVNNVFWNKTISNIRLNNDTITFDFSPQTTYISNTNKEELKVLTLPNTWRIDIKRGNYVAKIFSSSGKIVYSNRFTGNLSVNNSITPKGTYFIVVEDIDNNEIYRAKVVKR